MLIIMLKLIQLVTMNEIHIMIFGTARVWSRPLKPEDSTQTRIACSKPSGFNSTSVLI
jgi:hypothetical protein